MNSVQLLGNLARDPEVRYTKTGKAVASYTIAATNTYATAEGEVKEHTAFVQCVAWGRTSDAIRPLKKGDRVFTQGRLQVRSYEDKQGQKRYVTEVVADFAAAQPKDGGGNFEQFGAANEENIPF